MRFKTARELGEQLLTLAQYHDPALLLAAHQALGTTLYFLSEHVSSLTHLEQALAVCDLQEQRTLAVRYGMAHGVQCLAYMAQILWLIGYPDQAIQQRRIDSRGSWY